MFGFLPFPHKLSLPSDLSLNLLNQVTAVKSWLKTFCTCLFTREGPGEGPVLPRQRWKGPVTGFRRSEGSSTGKGSAPSERCQNMESGGSRSHPRLVFFDRWGPWSNRASILETGAPSDGSITNKESYCTNSSLISPYSITFSGYCTRTSNESLQPRSRSPCGAQRVPSSP